MTILHQSQRDNQTVTAKINRQRWEQFCRTVSQMTKLRSVLKVKPDVKMGFFPLDFGLLQENNLCEEKHEFMRQSSFLQQPNVHKKNVFIVFCV